MQTENVTVTPAALEAFQKFYLAELDERIKRSEVVGSITLTKGSAAIFYDASVGKFTLLEKSANVEEANIYDCEAREQWGRTVMLFGHSNNTGGYIPSGHATLDGNTLKIKLASGRYYRLEVDPTLPHLLPFVSAEPLKPREPAPKQEKKPRVPPNNNKVRQLREPARESFAEQEQVSSHSGADDDNEDLTEDDLRRLRGEMPLSSKPKKKWNR
jgi:hypothetical protein